LKKQNEKQNGKFNLCVTSDDIPLDDAHHKNTCDKLVVGNLKFDSILTLKCDYEIHKRLKDLNWLNGESVYLTEETALVLRDSMELALYLASGLRLVIIDTGASLSISNNPNDFPDGFEPCDIKLQGIGSGLRVMGKGKVQWRFQRENGGFVIVECMAYYALDMKFNLFSPQLYLLKESGKSEFKINQDGIIFVLNSNDSFKISLSSANLLVCYVSHNDALSENKALFTCATDARNVDLPQKSKRLLQWHYRLGHCSMKLVQWLFSKGIIVSYIV